MGIDTIDTINNNPITWSLPKLMYRDDMASTSYHDVQGRTLAPSLVRRFSIFTPSHIEESLDIHSAFQARSPSTNPSTGVLDSAFSFLRFCDLSSGQASFVYREELLLQNALYQLQQEQWEKRLCYADYPDQVPHAPFLIREAHRLRRSTTDSPLLRCGAFDPQFQPLIQSVWCYVPNAAAAPIIPACSDRRFVMQTHRFMHDGYQQKLLYGARYRVSEENPCILPYFPLQESVPEEGVLMPLFRIIPPNKITVPDFA